MGTINLSLNEIFKKNSLRVLKGTKNGPMPHKGSTHFIWNDCYHNNELSSILDNGKNYNTYSNLYIDMTDYAFELISSNFIAYGPNSTSSSLTVRFFTPDSDNVLITASGWGMSSCRLYDGPINDVIVYFRKNQKGIDTTN